MQAIGVTLERAVGVAQRLLHLAAQHPEARGGLALVRPVGLLKLAQRLLALPGHLAQLGANDIKRLALLPVEPLARDIAEDQPGGVGLAAGDRVLALWEPDLDRATLLVAMGEMIGRGGVLATLQAGDGGLAVQFLAQLKRELVVNDRRERWHKRDAPLAVSLDQAQPHQRIKRLRLQ